MNDIPHPEAPVNRRGRLQLLMLALVFAAPVIAAWVAWQYVGTHGVDQTSNAGHLVVPVRPLTAAGLQGPDGRPLADTLLRGRWTYVILAPDGCGELCQRQLTETRQVRVSVNKDMPRVQRLLLLRAAPSEQTLQTLRQAHPELQIALASDGVAPPLEVQVGAAGVPADGAHFALVDPLGNLMMTYGPDVPMKGVLKDLRKLLKASQIG